MTRFEWCVGQILEREGGYVFDPQDPGGETNFGISKRAYPDLDIETLTEFSAISLYQRDYWAKAHCEELPTPLDFYVFDMAVNQGVDKAIRLLQQVLRVPIDGVVGPVTINAAWRSNRPETGALFMARRVRQYLILPTFERFGEGWLKRLFLVSAAHEG